MGSRIRYTVLATGGGTGGVQFGAIAYYLNTVPTTAAGVREIGENVFGRTTTLPDNTIIPHKINLSGRSSVMLNTS
jgi:hypothetical protein